MSISQENNNNKNILGNFEVNEEKDIAVVSCELPRDIRSISLFFLFSLYLSTSFSPSFENILRRSFNWSLAKIPIQ